MKDNTNAYLIGVLLSLAICGLVSSSVAQDAKIERLEFLDYLAISRNLTKDTPFRESTIIQTSYLPDRDWKPYSSWVAESVSPDRSYLSYKTGRQGDFVRIGKVLYSREQPASSWVRIEDDGKQWIYARPNPASVPGFRGPLVNYHVLEKSVTGTVIRVTSKPNELAESKDTLIYFYSFDRNGVLFRLESVGHNGRDFVRRTESYEYDPDINIEAPIR